MTVPQAVSIAKLRLHEVMPAFEQDAMELEELNTPPFGSSWQFTFAVNLPVSSGSSLAELMRGRRVAKTVEIDAESGQLLAVRNAVA